MIHAHLKEKDGLLYCSSKQRSSIGIVVKAMGHGYGRWTCLET